MAGVIINVVMSAAKSNISIHGQFACDGGAVIFPFQLQIPPRSTSFSNDHATSDVHCSYSSDHQSHNVSTFRVSWVLTWRISFAELLLFLKRGYERSGRFGTSPCLGRMVAAHDLHKKIKRQVL